MENCAMDSGYAISAANAMVQILYFLSVYCAQKSGALVRMCRAICAALDLHD
jgi:hypothetical protein